MSKKTSTVAIWLLLVCGGAVSVMAFLSRRVDKMPWQRPPVPPLLKIKAGPFEAFEGRALAFTAGGTKLISQSRGRLQLWDIQNGKSLALPDLTSSVLALSPNGQVAAVSRPGILERTVKHSYWFQDRKTITLPDGSIKGEATGAKKRLTYQQRIYVHGGIDLYNVLSGALLCSIPLPDDKPNTIHDRVEAESSSFSPDDSRFFVMLKSRHPKQHGKYLRESQLWDVRSGRLMWKRQSVPDDFEKTPYIFFTDNKTVVHATSPQDKSHYWLRTLKLEDQHTGKSIAAYKADGKLRQGSRLSWLPVVTSPDGRYVVTVYESAWDSQNDTIYLWSIAPGQLMWKSWQDRFNPTALVFSPDSKTLAVGGALWNLDGVYNMRGKLSLLDVQSGALKATLSEETTQDRFTQQWEIRSATTKKQIQKLQGAKPAAGSAFAPGDSGPVKSLVFAPDGKVLAAGYVDGSIKLWRVP